MNIPLLYFYLAAESNDTGLNILNVLYKWDPPNDFDKWEDCSAHHIQWLFPLPEPSAFNPEAPLMNEQTIDAFKKIPLIKKHITAAYSLACEFLFDPYIAADTKPFWMEKKNHNHLRITRMIKFFNLVDASGEKTLGTSIYENAVFFAERYPGIITETTLKFWKEAMEYPQPRKEPILHNHFGEVLKSNCLGCKSELGDKDHLKDFWTI